MKRQRVVIVYKTLPHYRVRFYELLRAELADRGILLELIVGQPDDEMAKRRDTAGIQWANLVRNRYIPLGRRQLVWQPCLRRVWGADLVIVEQASRLLLNYLLHLGRYFRGPKLALWGHGINLDSSSRSVLGETVKKFFLRKADWWFCYTEGTKRLVVGAGFAEHRATVVQNAIDTAALRAWRDSIADAERDGLREALGMGSGPVCLWLSSIYPTKRPEYAVLAFDEVRRRLPGAELIVVGDGPSKFVFDDARRTRPWLHTVGARFGRDIALHASLASLIINPGLVGLTVLDGFALGLPVVTVQLDYHSPEIEYLENGRNGLVLNRNASPEEYGAEVATLLSDGQRLSTFRDECALSACKYTVEQMVERFASGVQGALGG